MKRDIRIVRCNSMSPFRPLFVFLAKIRVGGGGITDFVDVVNMMDRSILDSGQGRPLRAVDSERDFQTLFHAAMVPLASDISVQERLHATARPRLVDEGIPKQLHNLRQIPPSMWTACTPRH